MEKVGIVQKEKTNKLEEELVMVRKKMQDYYARKDILQKELAKVRNEMGQEKFKLLNKIRVHIESIEEVYNWQVKETCKLREKIKELEEKLNLFDDGKKKNKVLKENVKKLEEKNNMLKKKLSTLKQEK